MAATLGGCEVQGVLCDISGVLAESSAAGDGVAVPGSVEAIARLAQAGIKVKFVTNESARTRESLHGKEGRTHCSAMLRAILVAAQHTAQPPTILFVLPS